MKTLKQHVKTRVKKQSWFGSRGCMAHYKRALIHLKGLYETRKNSTWTELNCSARHSPWSGMALFLFSNLIQPVWCTLHLYITRTRPGQVFSHWMCTVKVFIHCLQSNDLDNDERLKHQWVLYKTYFCLFPPLSITFPFTHVAKVFNARKLSDCLDQVRPLVFYRRFFKLLHIHQSPVCLCDIFRNLAHVMNKLHNLGNVWHFFTGVAIIHMTGASTWFILL